PLAASASMAAASPGAWDDAFTPLERIRSRAEGPSSATTTSNPARPSRRESMSRFISLSSTISSRAAGEPGGRSAVTGRGGCKAVAYHAEDGVRSDPVPRGGGPPPPPPDPGGRGVPTHASPHHVSSPHDHLPPHRRDRSDRRRPLPLCRAATG